MATTKKLKRNSKPTGKNAHIIVVLDRSGSMEVIKNETIGGFNTFLEEQQKLKIPTRLTLVQFDDKYEVVHQDKNIKDVEPLTEDTFVPRGFTALYDAIGKTIKIEEENIKKDTKVIFAIITDGAENASKEYKKQNIKELIDSKKDWQFTFLGANQDAVLTAKGINIPVSNALTYSNSKVGTSNAIRSMSLSVSDYIGGVSASVSYSDKDRSEALLKDLKK